MSPDRDTIKCYVIHDICCIFFTAKYVQPAASTIQQEKEKVEESPIQQQLTENVAGE